jgi:hypothetical protein
MSELRIPRPRAEVVAWTDDLVSPYRNAAWDAWLHGTVAVLEHDGQDVLVVPMAEPPAQARRVAERLYALGAVQRLTSD